MITYNRAGLIMHAINSILQQTFQHWELLVIDDGSTDDTEKLVKASGDERIVYHALPRCAATGKLKNYGMSHCTGTYISFLDSDDLWAPNKLEIQLEFMESHPGAGFSVTNGYNFREEGRALEYFYERKEGVRYGHLLNAAFQSELAAFTQALVLRRSCLESIGGYEDEENITMNDQDFILKLCNHFQGLIIYEPLVYRRLHSENYIHESWSKSYREGAALVKKYRKINAIDQPVADDALFRLYIRYGEKCLLNGKHQKASWQFLKAWRYRPASLIPIKKTAKLLLHVFNLHHLFRRAPAMTSPVAAPDKP